MYSPLWKITHQNPLVLCTPPFEKSLFLVGAYFGVSVYFGEYIMLYCREILLMLISVISEKNIVSNGNWKDFAFTPYFISVGVFFYGSGRYRIPKTGQILLATGLDRAVHRRERRLLRSELRGDLSHHQARNRSVVVREPAGILHYTFRPARRRSVLLR